MCCDADIFAPRYPPAGMRAPFVPEALAPLATGSMKLRIGTSVQAPRCRTDDVAITLVQVATVPASGLYDSPGRAAARIPYVLTSVRTSAGSRAGIRTAEETIRCDTHLIAKMSDTLA